MRLFLQTVAGVSKELELGSVLIAITATLKPTHLNL
jgi:hypothetical protein